MASEGLSAQSEYSEEERAFLQTRVALFWKSLFIIALIASGLGAIGTIVQPGLDSFGTFGRFDDPAATAAQVNGWVNLFFDAYGCNNTMYGVIAVTLPDTGSGVLRARGSFQARQFFH